MAQEDIVSTKMNGFQAESVTLEIAGTAGAYDTAAEATNSLMAMGFPAQVAILLVADGGTDGLMALGIPAATAVQIAADN